MEKTGNINFLKEVFFWHMVCRILIPQPGVKPTPRVQSPNPWTARDFPKEILKCPFLSFPLVTSPAILIFLLQL